MNRLQRALGSSVTGWLIAATISIAMLTACGQAPSRPSGPRAPIPPQVDVEPGKPITATVNGFENRIIEATNGFRSDHGLATLRPNARLIAIAQNHARNMARRDRYGDSDRNGHVLDGKNVEYRIKAGGYPFARIAENVGYQLNRPDSVASMMDGWKNSRGHRRNMLEPELTEIGVGAAQGKSGRWYFVQVFGRPASAASAVRTSN